MCQNTVNHHVNEERHCYVTLPEDASISFTGQSRTDATKQYVAGSRLDAEGYHIPPRTAAD